MNRERVTFTASVPCPSLFRSIGSFPVAIPLNVGKPSGMPSYLVLARKYRPTTFSDVVGQDHVIQTLSNALLSGRVAHAFLFCGVRGVGKTTVARILAKAINCSNRAEDGNPCNACTACKEITAGISVDVQEIDGASNTSVENIREINENIKYPPVSSPYKIIIIDEVHMISINAFNALLKTLEEPPPHAKFIFATTESHKVPATIHSRCQRFNFRTISVADIMGGMTRILAQEGIVADPEALALLAREAQGSFRDALSLLDQVIAFSPDRIAVAEVMDILGIAGRDSFRRLLAATLDRDPAACLAVVHELFHEGYDPEQFVLDLIQYVRNLVVVRTVPPAARAEGMIDAAPSEMDQLEELAARASVEELHNLFAMLMRAEGEIRRSVNPWVALEMTVLRMAYAPRLTDLAELLKRLDAAGPSGSESAENRHATVQPRVAQPPGSVLGKKPETGDSHPRTPKKPGAEEQIPAEGFTITKVTPMPSGTPDEVWSMLKDRVEATPGGVPLGKLLDHGKLISFGPTEVEIGFTKPLYKESFEKSLATKPLLKDLFQELFGNARIKVLTLAVETSLATQKPYAAPADGRTDFERALRHEAQENPVTKAVLEEFEDSSIDYIKVLATKP
jgi:DNA polymerase III subunit gamma/tau